MQRLLAALMAAALLAGCSSSPSADGTGPTPTASTSGTSTPGPLGDAGEEPVTPAPLTADCEVVRTNAGTPAGLGVYVDRALAPTGCVFDDLFDDLSWARSALVEVEWSPQPGMTAADAWFESDACVPSPTAPCELPRQAAPGSPLVLAIEGDDFADHVAENLEVQVAAQGAVAQQAFSVHVTLFANATVDEGFTAIP